MPRPSEDDDFVLLEDARGKFVRQKLDIVPLRIPSVELFPILVSYLCTLDEHWLLSTLLGIPPSPAASEPVQLPTPEASPPYLNKSAVEVSSLTQEVLSLSVQLATLHVDNCGAILAKAQKVWNLYRNAISLGVDESGLWTTMQTAWSVLLLAMDIVSKAGRARAAAN